MAQTMILPGTYVEVRAEGLIAPSGVPTGNIGIVGTANQGAENEVKLVSSLSEAKEIFGDSKQAPEIQVELTLVRALELIYKNGGQTVYAVRTSGAKPEDYQKSLALLENQIVNIVVLAGQDANQKSMVDALQGHLKTTAGIKRERIGIIGSGFKNDKDDFDQIRNHTLSDDEGRLIFTAPGILMTSAGKVETKSGAYLAAAIAGLIASLNVQASPTNKNLSIEGLTTEFNNAQLEELVQKKVLTVEARSGYRVVKGITTANSPWNQITTRRIVDYAIYGVRSSCDPYIGKLNNERVRGAMKATLDAFLTSMVESEALIGYQLEVSATRPQEVAGQVAVKMILQPTFSIDFIQVTMYLG
ncbi:phage tail sheath C-terminal domain-containing protein [Kamptonema sp. UHCC 0994]|uniref:phage tail sheath C-terminal domain-containing protein n=1 Tax=Kamptonema sp. UHCC 0994 TaxID=3031329 RepID=UPI0023B9CFDA|nr:phage tail sheath C-terminal domain-containing protein [Kamptonema sp. UHCC 0994]MDF0551805.1 phage tail sheath subtilisin-like domain-containing protein [Kamptonema sp. UHCC 0994]